MKNSDALNGRQLRARNCEVPENFAILDENLSFNELEPFSCSLGK